MSDRKAPVSGYRALSALLHCGTDLSGSFRWTYRPGTGDSYALSRMACAGNPVSFESA